METDSDESACKRLGSWILRTLIAMAIVGTLAWIAMPNFIGGGPGKLTGVINVLRQLDGAKQQWAFEQGLTNNVNVTRQITSQDIARYLVHGEDQNRVDRFGFGFDPNGNILSPEGIVYSINPLGISPEALLTSDFRDKRWPRGWRLPKGTIIRFGTNSSEEYVLPGQESNPRKSAHEALMGR